MLFPVPCKLFVACIRLVYEVMKEKQFIVAPGQTGGFPG